MPLASFVPDRKTRVRLSNDQFETGILANGNIETAMASGILPVLNVSRIIFNVCFSLSFNFFGLLFMAVCFL